MKTLILYTSNTGSCKTYAEDLAKVVKADVFPLKGYKLKKMSDYDTIVYFGWVKGGEIVGLNKFLTEWDRISDKNVLVASAGMSIPSDEGRRSLISQNLLDMYHIRYYQMRGSFDFSKLSFPYNILISRSLDAMASSEEESYKKEYLSKIKDEPLEYYDKEKFDRIVAVLSKIESEMSA